MHKNFCPKASESLISSLFNESAVPSLVDYIKIPNLSRSYDPQWNCQQDNKLLQAANHIKNWIEGLKIKGLKTQIIKQKQYSPLIFTEIQGSGEGCLLFYGHFDKQPPFTGWSEGLGATIPVIRDGKLYGRGGADDGYSTYGTMIAIKAVQEQGLTMPRCVMITEGDEQSGSAHLFHYLDKLKNRIGNPDIIFCLDSGTIDYDRFWLTNSLRGNLVATMRVQCLEEGVHSGDASGVVSSCWRVANILLNRIENIQTGVFNDKFMVNIPGNRYNQNYRLAEIKGKQAIAAFPLIKGAKPITQNSLDCLLNRAWKPTLTVIGQKQFPQAKGSGNVMLPALQLRFSVRMPPTLNSQEAVKNLTQLLTKNVPYDAHVELKNVRAAKGWNAPSYSQNLQKLIAQSSQLYFNNEWLAFGEGGSIPIMGKFSQLWPKGQFIITGVLGPNSNAHGPNQFLHLQYTRKLICSMAHIIAGVSEEKNGGKCTKQTKKVQQGHHDHKEQKKHQ